jgi:hypothetical protein
MACPVKIDGTFGWSLDLPVAAYNGVAQFQGDTVSKGSKKRRAAAIAQAQKERREDKAHDVKPPTTPLPQAPATNNSVATPATPQPAAPKDDKTRRDRALSWLKFTWTNLGGVAFILALIGLAYTHQQTKELRRQNDLTERNQKRQTGEVAAKMQLAECNPAMQHYIDHEMYIKAFGSYAPYYKDVERFLLLTPKLIMNNDGDEPIEAVRLVTRCVRVELDSDKNVQPVNTVWLREEDREEIVLPQQWLPNTAVEVSLVKGILAQMVQIQGLQKPDVLHRAVFVVFVHGKLTNATIFFALAASICKARWSVSACGSDARVNKTVESQDTDRR